MMMSWMRKLSTTLLLCANVMAASDAEVTGFLEKAIGANKTVSNVNVTIKGKKDLSTSDDWKAYFVNIEADVKQGNTNQRITQNGLYFVNGSMMTPELVNIKTGERYNETITPEFKSSYYDAHNLISGDRNSEHKVAIFSDPLCPYCRQYVPSAIQYMMKYPKQFALYYYHFPLSSIHPAAVTLVKAAIVADQQGIKDVYSKFYTVQVNANEKDDQKILDAFNKVFGTKIDLDDLKKPAVLKALQADQEVAESMIVGGTPTVFFDGQKDATRTKYKSVKVK